MINIKLITNIFKVICLIGILLLFMNSCQSISAKTNQIEFQNCTQLQKEFKILLKEHEKLSKENKSLKTKIKLLEKIDREKMIMLKELGEITSKLEKK